jgi:hypothetical protein
MSDSEPWRPSTSTHLPMPQLQFGTMALMLVRLRELAGLVHCGSLRRHDDDRSRHRRM